MTPAYTVICFAGDQGAWIMNMTVDSRHACQVPQREILCLFAQAIFAIQTHLKRSFRTEGTVTLPSRYAEMQETQGDFFPPNSQPLYLHFTASD